MFFFRITAGSNQSAELGKQPFRGKIFGERLFQLHQIGQMAFSIRLNRQFFPDVELPEKGFKHVNKTLFLPQLLQAAEKFPVIKQSIRAAAFSIEF